MKPNQLDGDDPYLMTIISPTCGLCSHYINGRTCKAFQDGIPPEIWLGKNDHTKPYPGDNGIQFEKVTQ